jgi:hypothetical protein
LREYSVLVFEKEPFLAQILESILEGELRDYPLSIHNVSDFAALGKELSTQQHYDVLVADLLDWAEEDYKSFREVAGAFPSLGIVLAGDIRTAPDDIAEHSNTVITPRVSKHISEAVLDMLLGTGNERS